MDRQALLGLGYATEAARAIILHAFQKEAFDYLTAGHFRENPASARVIAKLGFERSGEVLRDCAATGGKARCITYRLTPVHARSAGTPSLFRELGATASALINLLYPVSRAKPARRDSPEAERCFRSGASPCSSSIKPRSMCVPATAATAASSFRREKYIEFGGPDGGDGGKGGDVILECVANLNTLLDYRYKQHYKAKKGGHGMGQNRTGARRRRCGAQGAARHAGVRGGWRDADRRSDQARG